jgi:CarD family transcriptional regulator
MVRGDWQALAESEIERVYQILRSPSTVERTTWNQRYREFSDKLRTGSASAVAEVLRDLCTLRDLKDLSYGEKKMLDKALSLLSTEISTVVGRDDDVIAAEIMSRVF